MCKSAPNTTEAALKDRLGAIGCRRARLGLDGLIAQLALTPKLTQAANLLKFCAGFEPKSPSPAQSRMNHTQSPREWPLWSRGVVTECQARPTAGLFHIDP